MQPLIEQALTARVPLIHVTSTDLIHVQEVLSFIAGEEVYPLSLGDEGNHCDLDNDLYFTSDDVVSKTLYLEFKSANKSLVYVNTKLSLFQFDAGILMPPVKMMTNYLQDLIPESESVDSLVPAFSGMTLKEMFDTFKLTDYKVGVITPQDIHSTRRGLISKARGLEQVDTDFEFYQCPSYLSKWMKLNTDFFLKPKVHSLTPRGLLLDGNPGTGKTLACKYIAKQWGLPLYRIDVGSLKAKYVGESEQFLRNALSQLDCVGPCVVGDTLIRVTPDLSLTAKEIWETKRYPVTTETISEDGHVVETLIKGAIRRELEPERFLLTITDEDGNMITVTDNHKLLVKENECLIWKEASSLRENDELVKW